MTSFLQQATGLFTGLFIDGFDYNRENFLYDRKQRQVMEYQLAEMRMKQVSLWRKDVRDYINLAPKKMNVYLLVIALELNTAAVALCKGRLPPGVPSWLAACHTLAVISAMIYLILGLWFGLQAFVSAQAYKVRILTQLVRLPVPSWQSLEASRTYASSFETVKGRQMLRVPFVTGTQEGHLPAVPEENASATPSSGQGEGAASETASADPWGLEKAGEHVSELRPDVNTQVERQRHVWLIREAARFYQSYDAFCRISLSAGTSSLAQFFAFFCLTYVLTENAAPIAAWAGMAVFNGISIMFMRVDLLLQGRQYITAVVLLLVSPVLCGIVTFVNSKTKGETGAWELLMPVALFGRGLWYMYYLMLFRVEEVQNSVLLPMAFKAVLFIDPFAWAKHSGTWLRQLRTAMSLRGNGSAPPAMESTLPSLQCMGPARRPEDLAGQPSVQGDAEAFGADAAFRPRTFTCHQDDLADGAEGDGASDIHAEKPGLVPWRYFFMNTLLIAFMWWAAAIVAAMNCFQGRTIWVQATYGLAPGQVAPLPMLHGMRVDTAFPAPLTEPHGLACDAEGRRFATAGRGSDGRHVLLQGNLLENDISFAEAQPCAEMEEPGMQVQDISLEGCAEGQGCAALVLPRRGGHLVSCPLHDDGETRPTSPMARGWLEDRGGDGVAPGGLLVPEEPASLLAVPCKEGRCAVVGTTARRVVRLSESSGRWLPQRLLRGDHGEVPGPGALALLGGRYLAALQRNASLLRVTDLQTGGTAGSWALPVGGLGSGRAWGAVCAGAEALYAMESGASPGIWRFPLPSALKGTP